MCTRSIGICMATFLLAGGRFCPAGLINGDFELGADGWEDDSMPGPGDHPFIRRVPPAPPGPGAGRYLFMGDRPGTPAAGVPLQIISQFFDCSDDDDDTHWCTIDFQANLLPGPDEVAEIMLGNSSGVRVREIPAGNAHHTLSIPDCLPNTYIAFAFYDSNGDPVVGSLQIDDVGDHCQGQDMTTLFGPDLEPFELHRYGPLETEVPEPAAATLLAIGALGALRRRC